MGADNGVASDVGEQPQFVGFVIFLVAGTVWLGQIDHLTPMWQIGVAMAMLGFGMGAMMQNLVLAVQNSVDVSNIGAASATIAFFRTLGGAIGGFTTGHKEVIEMLRQRSRPYLFSNSLPPSVVAAAIKVFDMLSSAGDLRAKLKENTTYFRERMTAAGFEIKPGVHPIVPVMTHDAQLAQSMAAGLLDEGIYVSGFFFPVVPKGEARIRTQMSAAHTRAQLDHAIAAFIKVARALGVAGIH